ncbi:MAG: isopenicillin N synthase family oxygenase [Chlamydiae bacterium]|nr:isopenicillin N synthase family oxygenase [Chlamydiota bacterium]
MSIVFDPTKVTSNISLSSTTTPLPSVPPPTPNITSSMSPTGPGSPFPSHFVTPRDNALVLDQAPIPLVDLGAIGAATGSARAALIKEFGDGLKNIGFIAVKASELQSLLPSVFKEMESFFLQPIEEKMKEWRNNGGQTGFSQQGRETGAGAKAADLKETYFIPPNFTDYPKNREGFATTMTAYHKALTEIAAQVMSFIAEYLGEATEDVSTSVNSANNLLRLAHYPAPSPGDHPEAVWASAHKDLNALTLLPPTKVPGLQLLTKEGEWKSVHVPPGYLIVNTGEQLESKTAGMIKATPHRVVNPGGEFAQQRRFSTPFFAAWSPSFSLEPFPSCAEKMTQGMSTEEKNKYLKRFPTVTVEEALLSRLIEMRTIPTPDLALVQTLRNKGLIQTPPKELQKLYPGVFA